MASLSAKGKERDKHDADGRKKKDDKRGQETIPLYKLFSFPDTLDIILMIFGTFAALANGFSLPSLAFMVGKLIDSFGENANSSNLVHEVSKVSLNFVYFGIGSVLLPRIGLLDGYRGKTIRTVKKVHWTLKEDQSPSCQQQES